MDALARAFKCPRTLTGKHMMRFIARYKRWPTDSKPYARFQCEHCGYTFNSHL